MLASKIKEIRNGRVIVKDSKIGDANPDGTISPDEEKRMAELLREANESKSRLKAKAYEIGGSFRGPGNWKRVKSILTSDSKTKDVKTFNSEEDWRATVREIGGRVEEIQTDKNILFAYLSGNRVVGQFDRNKKKGVIEDSKTKDVKTQHEYKGYILEWDNEDNNIPVKIISPSGKVIFTYVIGTMPTLTGFNSKVDAHLSKTKDAWKIGESIKYFINGQANYGRIIDYDDSTNDGSVIYHVVSNKNSDKDYFITMNKEHSRQMSIRE